MKPITSPNHLYPGLYDSHCHLFLLRKVGLDVRAVLRQWRADGLESLMNIALEPSEEDWNWHLDLLRECRNQPELYPKLLLAVGIHPNDADGSSGSRYVSAAVTGGSGPDGDAPEPGLELLARRAAMEEVQAIGETGLDYYRAEENKELQQKSLEFQIGLARQHRKVLVIHNRDSDEDIRDLLCRSENQLPAGGIMHCFSGNPALIDALLDKGFYFSFAGNVSYKNAENLRHAAGLVPAERLLIETDAPFLAPQPVRGQINHSGFIGHTMDVLARCHGMETETMLAQLRRNWQRLFPCLDLNDLD
ncbi:TatD family hydrolase [Candidatus Haliotispira prima]|uniref:TatD family hydrolase n=1 Tax=Candidatus Haliotispira prima TaxID=3034016 RepID=A0ABY8MFB7_9SPIO|nr:TatD family hydrolase [Candidatus Haliotispira prima]